MKTIMRYLICLALVITAAPGTSRSQSAAQELRLSDIKAQQPQEKIFASAPCQRALQDPGRGWIFERYEVDPQAFVEDLNSLTKMSDEVVLAGLTDRAVVLSPSGQRVITYHEVKIIHSWKGTHPAGDRLTFGIPFGGVPCELSSSGIITRRFDFSPRDFGGFGAPVSYGLPETDSFAYLLFLRQSKGDETNLIQGLRLAAGEGLQGVFLIPVPVPVTADVSVEDYCLGDGVDVNVQHCEAIMQTNQSPVAVPYRKDPLAKKYNGMPASAFLQEIQSVAAGQGVAEKSSSK